ncbi:MAG: IS110 family transposase [Lachnospiraceae bacterium]|nr:IS110 family transposase [Lachnospiraceae bacterium]
MLAFAGLDPGYYQSGIAEHRGRMVKRGSSHLRYALYNCCLPLIRYDMTFASYYAKRELKESLTKSQWLMLQKS